MGNLEKLDKAVEQLELQSRDLEEFVRIYKLIESLKSDIELSQAKIIENNSSFNELSDKLQNVLSEHSDSLAALENKLLGKVRELYDDNKKYQKELDGTINTKLEKNKSDLEVTVRNEGNQIQRAFETSLKSHFTNLSGSLDERFVEQTKKNNKVMAILVLILLMQIIMSTMIYLY